MRDVDERQERFPSITLVPPALKRSTHSYTFRCFMLHYPYCTNTQRWISAGLSPSTRRTLTMARCSSMVQLMSRSPISLASFLYSARLNDGMPPAASYLSPHAHPCCRASTPSSCFYLKISKLLLPSYLLGYLLKDINMEAFVKQITYRSVLTSQRIFIREAHSEE